MATGKAAQVVTRQVRPILSISQDEARRRALALYKAWYRQIPITGNNRCNVITLELTQS